MLHEIPFRQKLTVMIAVMCGLLLAALDQTIIATALGRIVEDFNSFDSLSWVVTAYLITTTITVPIAGKLSDIFGRRNMLMVGVALFTLASLLSGSAQNIGELIGARAFQGIGGGILMTSAFTIIGDLFTPRERGKWQGVIGGVFGLSSVIGPLLGGYLTDPHNILGLVTNWRWTFWINVPVGILAFIVITIYTPNFKHALKNRIDFLGAGLLAAALAAVIFACEDPTSIFAHVINDWHISGSWVRAIFGAAAAILAGLFVLVERKAESPIVPLHMFKWPVFRVVMPIMLLFGAAFLGAILYLTQFLQQVLDASPTTSGLMLMPLIFSLAITSIVVGRVVSKIGRYKVIMFIGLLVATTGVLSLAALTVHSTFWDVAWRMIITGAGLGASMPIFNLIVQNEAPHKELGVATSSVQLSRSLGSTVGTALFGGLLTAGVTFGLGTIAQDPFVATLKQSPAAAQVLGTGGTVDANAALTLNTPEVKDKIRSGIRTGIEQTQLPAPVKQKLIDQKLGEQSKFSDRVKDAFASSLHTVFLWAGGTMVLAIILSIFVKEIPLRDSSDQLAGKAEI
ncbi:MAG TPA: MDR family MFS transporter [Candidatus Saccharimonadales bacterium]|jgi:EmrB/QacA subfamily drug resistance transporter|nr:MDR family MFS transporter [Candidatus Saccharimonadales bacterium]